MHPVIEIFAAFDNSPTDLSVATGIPVQTVHDWKAKGKPNIPTWRRATVLEAVRKAKATLSPETLTYLGAPPATPRRSARVQG